MKSGKLATFCASRLCMLYSARIFVEARSEPEST
jgi:hypothetical protein